MKSSRNPVFDIAKFVLMLFVVHGHIPHLFSSESSSGMSYFSNFNIGMAMPCFFIMSGYFAGSSMKDRFFSRVSGYLWPLLSFGVIVGVARYLCGELPLWKLLEYPANHLLHGGWFLRTLAIVYLLHGLTWKIVAGTRNRMAVLSLAYVVLFFMPRGGGFYWSSSVVNMFPYFTFGVLALRAWNLQEKWYLAFPCGVLFASVCLFEGNIRTNGMGFYWVSTYWRDVLFDKHQLFCFVARYVIGICGSISFLWIVGLVLRVLPFIERLAPFGTTTLGVYLLHEWPLMLVGRHFTIAPFPQYLQWMLAIALFFACHFIVLAIRKSEILRTWFLGEGLFRENGIGKSLRNLITCKR